MTENYAPGSEDVGVAVVPGEDGFVRLRIIRFENGEPTEVIITVGPPPQSARNIAFNLTTASFKCEDGEGVA